MTRLATALGLAGVALATALVVRAGAGDVVSAVAAAGLGVLWASLFHVVPMAVNARAWQLLCLGGRRPSAAHFTWLVLVREAVNGLLPVARVGGELVTARLLARRGVRPGRAAASLVADMTLSLASQLVFTLGGVALLVLRHGGGPIARRAALAALVAVPVVTALTLLQRAAPFSVFEGALRRAFGDRFRQLPGAARRLDGALRAVYRRRLLVAHSLGWQVAAWVVGAGEIAIALRFLGEPVPLADAVVIEALVQAASSAAFVVPAAAGVQEGTFLGVGALVGLSPQGALALALCRRARDLLLFVPALLAWQLQEGRAVLAAPPRET